MSHLGLSLARLKSLTEPLGGLVIARTSALRRMKACCRASSRSHTISVELAAPVVRQRPQIGVQDPTTICIVHQMRRRQNSTPFRLGSLGRCLHFVSLKNAGYKKHLSLTPEYCIQHRIWRKLVILVLGTRSRRDHAILNLQ
jgi:hypothetical protein